jgi:hypothetical protein
LKIYNKKIQETGSNKRQASSERDIYSVKHRQRSDIYFRGRELTYTQNGKELSRFYLISILAHPVVTVFSEVAEAGAGIQGVAANIS